MKTLIVRLLVVFGLAAGLVFAGTPGLAAAPSVAPQTQQGTPAFPQPTAVLPAQPRNSIERTTTPRPPRLWLGLGALGSLDMQGAGGVLSGEVAWARLVGRMGMLATITAPLPRETSVGQGTAGRGPCAAISTAATGRTFKSL